MTKYLSVGSNFFQSSSIMKFYFHEKFREIDFSFLSRFESFSRKNSDIQQFQFGKKSHQNFFPSNQLYSNSFSYVFSRNFCQKSVRVNFRNFHTVWQLHCCTKYILFWRIFRQINLFTKSMQSYYCILWIDFTKFLKSRIFELVYIHTCMYVHIDCRLRRLRWLRMCKSFEKSFSKSQTYRWIIPCPYTCS